ncbi:MAG: helix-turn-helix transcriptional regulator [Actinomycetota bacterium]
MSKTAFGRYFDKRMEDPEFRGAYEEARARIAAIDHLVASLDAEREEKGLSKAELARRMGVRPEAVRRLFTAPSPNPTLDTVVGAARALGLRVIIERETRAHPGRGLGARISSGRPPGRAAVRGV